MAIFTPDNEPYLGVPTVHMLDRLIPPALDQQRAVAAWTHTHGQDRLQMAARMLIPGASSIILSIREMVRQA